MHVSQYGVLGLMLAALYACGDSPASTSAGNGGSGRSGGSVPAAQGIDVAVTGLLNSNNGQSVRIGTPWTLTATVTNKGTVTSPATTLSWRGQSTVPGLDPTWFVFSTTSVPALAPGQSATFAYQATCICTSENWQANLMNVPGDTHTDDKQLTVAQTAVAQSASG